MRRRAVLPHRAALEEVATIGPVPTSSPASVRLLGGVNAVLGTVLLIAPSQLLRQLPHGRIDATARTVARILGARHLVQAAILARARARSSCLLAGAAVDATHAVSMTILAGLRPDRRKLALTSALTASVLAGSGAWAARRPERRDGSG